MFIEIDRNSGFCYGVVNTIGLAEQLLQDGKPVYCLGEIVHNEEEVRRLTSKGLKIINHSDLGEIRNATVLIRAHGEPPKTYQQLEANENTFTDGTCPIVLHLQKKIRTAWAELEPLNGQVVIYGKKDHAEVIGLAGQLEGKAIVVSAIDDIDQIDPSRPVALFSQTTQSMEGYNEISNAIQQKMKNHFHEDSIPLKVTDSVCKHVSKRGENLREFAKKHSVIVFVCGTKSSNGKVLFDICKGINPQSFWVPSAEMVKNEWFENTDSVGICGATSTPVWLMEDVAEKIKTLQ